MKKEIFIVWLMVNCLIFLGARVMAQEKEGRIHVGNLKIIPGITFQGVYDDNIYLSNGSNDDDGGEESDWITHVTPSILFDFAFLGRGHLKLGYQGDLAYYAEKDENDWQNHRGIFGLNYEAPGGLIVDIDNTYVNAEDPYGSENEYKLGVPQVSRWSNGLKTKIGHAFSDKFKVLGFYNYYTQDYDSRVDFTQDYDVNEFGIGFQMRLLPKTWGFIRYHYGERDYFTHPAGTGVTESNDSDFKWHRVNTGLTWDSGAKLSGELNFGYQWKDYDNLTDVNGRRYDDKDTWIASTFMSFEATATTTLDFSVVRALRETGSDTNEFFEDTGIGINLRQLIFTKAQLYAGATYSRNDYNLSEGEPRKDDNYKANIGIYYLIRGWMRVGVGYDYWKKNSDRSEYEFTDNRFTASLSIVY